jgi:transcriptional regulator with XRE-family HTH domain
LLYARDVAKRRAAADSLGEIIRRQRELSDLSMRQFAQMAGISNPYLSQIERGLREPSERVLDAIADALSVSTDALYDEAGIDRDSEPETPAVIEAARADRRLTGRQRQALVEIYEAFIAANAGGRPRARAASARAAPRDP